MVVASHPARVLEPTALADAAGTAWAFAEEAIVRAGHELGVQLGGEMPLVVELQAAAGAAGSVNVGSSLYDAEANTAAEDFAMIQSSWLAAVAALLTLLVWGGARCSPRLMHHVFSPATWAANPDPEQESPSWLQAIREDARTVVTGGVGLEAAMLMRYIRYNLRLLLWALLLAFAFLGPAYAAYPWSHTNALSQSTSPNCTTTDESAPLTKAQLVEYGCVTWWSVTQMLTIAHVPEASWRLMLPGIAAILYALVYVYEQTHEYRHYVAAKHAWLAEEADLSSVAVLVYAESRSPVQAHELYGELERVLGAGEVTSIAPLARLRAGQSAAGLLEQASYEYLQQAQNLAQPLLGGGVGGAVGGAVGGTVGVVKQVSRDAARATKADVAGQVTLQVASDAVRLALFGEEEPLVTRFLVLLRTRKSAAICVGMTRWPGELLAVPGFVRCEPAPAPADAYWPNLLKARFWLRFNAGLGMALAALLFTFWTVPVAFVQALASVQNIAMVPALAFLRPYLEALSPNMRATITGFLASMVLQFFLYVTLYSGLFQWLARMSGKVSQTQVQQRTLSLMLLFQLLLVLLVSNITSSLYDSLQTIIADPLTLPTMLAQNLPNQATFFMHYSLSGILYVCIFDGWQLSQLFITQVWPLILSGLCCRDKRIPTDEPILADRSYQLQRIVTIYAKLYLMTGIWVVYLFVAPFASVISFLYFVPSYWLCGFLLRQVDGKCAVDSAGVCWETAIRYTNWTYIIGHVLLIGILTLKGRPSGVPLVVVALVYMMVRTANLRRKFEGQAAALSLQMCVELQRKEEEERVVQQQQSLVPPDSKDAPWTGSSSTIEAYSTADGVRESAAWGAESLRAEMTAMAPPPPGDKPAQPRSRLSSLFGGA